MDTIIPHVLITGGVRHTSVVKDIIWVQGVIVKLVHDDRRLRMIHFAEVTLDLIVERSLGLT